MRTAINTKSSNKNQRNSSFFRKGGEQSFFSNNLVQTKLSIGQPGDVYEQEADRMADYVMSNSSSKSIDSSGAPGIQNKCAACEEKDKSVLPKLQKMEMHGEEKEDMAMTKPEIQKLADSPEGVREDDDPLYSPMQLKSNGNPQEASEGLSQNLSRSKGGGNPLPDKTRSEMESSFGTDFSSVRVHTGSNSVQMNQELGAQAFTNGSDVYFNSGKYSPESSGGKHLLAHELTHVVQQGAGGNSIQRKVKTSPCAVHAYDSSNAKDKAVIPDNASSHSYELGVTSTDDLVSKVNQYINSPKNSCKCVSKLEVNGHGTDGYQSIGNGVNYVNDNKALVHDSKKSHLEKLKSIKFCGTGLLLLMGCHTGRGLGKKLLKRISNILPGILIGGAQHFTHGTGLGKKKVVGKGDAITSSGHVADTSKSKLFLESPYVNWHLTINGKEYTITGADAATPSGQSKLKTADKVKVKTPEGEIIKIK